jgi:hypothetical protein
MKQLTYIIFLNLFFLNAVADNRVMSFIYEEKESGTEPIMVRYLVNKLFLRIDNGGLQDDFLLFDRKNKIIYSVNQEDQSILVIHSYKWSEPEFSFDVKVDKKILNDAPAVAGQKILDYSKTASATLCHRVQIIPGLYNEEMKAFVEYQMVLSGQQVKILNNTPEDLRSPCLLVDQVYNAGNYYRLGLPIQEFHSRGYVKRLKDYQQIKVEEEWFVLPEKFRRYSISD